MKEVELLDKIELPMVRLGSNEKLYTNSSYQDRVRYPQQSLNIRHTVCPPPQATAILCWVATILLDHTHTRQQG